MSMTIAAATARISRQLPATEISLDDALLASARLMETLVMARKSDGVPVFAGQTALMRLAKSQRALIEAQSDMMRGHADLLAVGHDVKAVVDQPGDCPGQNSGALAEVETAMSLRAA